jgi:hypothetical protein
MIRVSEQQDFGTLSFGGLGKPISRFTSAGRDDLRGGDVTAVTNAYGYEVQICTGTGAWTTVKYWSQARTIPLTGLTTGTVYNVRVRALGGSTGQSDWSMPGSSIVD